MKQVEINFKMFVLCGYHCYWLYFHSLNEAQRFAENELRKSVLWIIHDVNGHAIKWKF